MNYGNDQNAFLFADTHDPLGLLGKNTPWVFRYTVTEKGEAMTHFYQIRVRGHLSDNWAEWFDGLTIENQPNGDALLSGPVADQAALHGLLVKVRDLNLQLVSVNRIASGSPPAESSEARSAVRDALPQ